MKRVVVTGMAGVTAFGTSWQEIHDAFRARKNVTQRMQEWDRFTDLGTKLAAPIGHFKAPEHWTRKQLRGMGRVSQLAVRASEIALERAGLLGDAVLKSGRTGVACGSCVGSTPDIQDFVLMVINGTSPGLSANSYVRMMPHTAAANISMFFGLKGRIIPTSSACTSGSQAIGYAFESIRHGLQTVMLAGGAEELCPSEAIAFDMLYATSRKNESPSGTPRPYDRDRDGLVIGEGSGMLVLEELEHAKARGATIHAEVKGFATNSDGVHATKPEEDTMRFVMELALQEAGIDAKAIGYINGHGTATEQGDIAESRATAAVFGSNVPMSTQKSYLGHTLGACGALESWFSIEMMKDGWFAPTINLDNLDPRCGELDYIVGDGRALDVEHVVTNNFAFGGVNTSIVLSRWKDAA